MADRIDAAARAVFEFLLTDTLGWDLSALGDACLRRALADGMRRSRTAGEEDYLAHLRTSPEEQERLREDLAVPETWFFRDREPFVCLRDHVRAHRPNPADRTPLRILSVPCSTGEEPYSIVMTLLEAGLPAGAFFVDAVDISRRCLEAARSALYGRGSFRTAWGDFRDRHFSPVEDRWMLHDEVRAAVRFSQDNALSPSFLLDRDPYPVLFCRNLLIYLHDAAKRQLLDNLNRLLSPGGILFCGHTETSFFQQHGFAAVEHPRAFACRRRTQSLPVAPGPALPRRPPPPAKPFTRTPARAAPPAAPVSPQPPSSPAGPDHPAGRIRALADGGDLEAALAECRQAIEERPSDAGLYCLLGLIQDGRRRTAEAEAAFAKALYLDPGHYEALIHASLIRRLRGDDAVARRLRERARRNGPPGEVIDGAGS